MISAGKVPQLLTKRRKQNILNLTPSSPATVRNINIFISKITAEDVILLYLNLFLKSELDEQMLTLPQWKMKSAFYPHNKSSLSKIRADKPLLKYCSTLFTCFCFTHHYYLNQIFPVLLPFSYPGGNTMCLIFKHVFSPLIKKSEFYTLKRKESLQQIFNCAEVTCSTILNRFLGIKFPAFTV